MFCGHSILTEGVFLAQLSAKCGNRILTSCVGCENWLLLGRRLVVSGPVSYSAAYCAATVLFIRFQARSHNCEKRLLASSCPSVCPYGTARFPLDWFSLNCIFVYFSKICREDSSLITI